MALRFSTVEPREIAEVMRLRDMHRGVLPLPAHPGGVPAGIEEQATDAVLGKAVPRLAVVLRKLTPVLSKAYVRSHTRTLRDGRTVTIPAYFTKKVAQAEQASGKQRAVKQAPPAGVHTGLTPEQLAHRLVRHVQEGSLTHEEAEANIAHLERRAQRGHGLAHGHGPDWHAGQVHEFVEHARGKLKTHRTTQLRLEHEEEELQRKEMEEHQHAQAQRATADVYGEHAVQGQSQTHEADTHRPAQGITQQERQQAWDKQMRQRQQAERERQQSQAAREQQQPRRARGQRHRENVQALLTRRTMTKSRPLVFIPLPCR